MKIIINKLETSMQEIDGNMTEVTTLVPTNYEQATQGSYLIYNPVTGENISESSLEDMQKTYEQINLMINQIQAAEQSLLDFRYSVFITGSHDAGDDVSPYPYALEIV